MGAERSGWDEELGGVQARATRNSLAASQHGATAGRSHDPADLTDSDIGAIADIARRLPTWVSFTASEALHMAGSAADPAAYPTATEFEGRLLRRFAGRPIHDRVITCIDEKVGRWQVVDRQHRRRSAQLDSALPDRPTLTDLWQHRSLTPFPNVDCAMLAELVSVWAGVEHCRCGQMARHLVTEGNVRAMRLMCCRPPLDPDAQAMIERLESRFRPGVAFTAAEAADLLDMSTVGAGRRLSTVAALIPPAAGLWLAKLGVFGGGGGRPGRGKAAYTIVAW